MTGLKYALIAAVSGILLMPAPVLAKICGPVTVNTPSAGALQDTIETEVCSQINSKFQTGNMGPVLSYMANAYGMAANGRTADYATNMQVFSLGVGTTVAVNNLALPTSVSDFEAIGKRFSGGGIPDFGMGFSATATFGISFRQMSFRRRGWFDPKNFNLYFSFIVTPALSYQSYTVNSTSGGVYIQYKVLPMRKIPLGLVTWGGLDIGLGYNYATTKLGVSSTDKITTVSFDTNGKHVDYEPAGTLSLRYQSHIIPLEVSTNFSLLYFLSFVAGGAADFHLLTSAEVAAQISGPIKIDGTATAGDNASFTLSETGKASAVSFRVFGGPQFNIWKIRIFTLVHASNNQTYGITAGARFTW